MAGAPVVRPFAWGDVPAITAIYAHYVATSTATFDTRAPSESDMADKFGRLVEAGYPVLVAERGGTLVGYAYASAYRPRPAYDLTCEDTVYCAPDAVGQGVGRALLGALVERCRADGRRQMIAVICDETGASVALHEAFGFRVAGRFPAIGRKFDRWLDVVHMQLAL